MTHLYYTYIWRYTYRARLLTTYIMFEPKKQRKRISTKDKKPIHNVNLISTQKSKNQNTKVIKNF
jgi:hypothetical protein